jgi:hypothetical protein
VNTRQHRRSRQLFAQSPSEERTIDAGESEVSSCAGWRAAAHQEARRMPRSAVLEPQMSGFCRGCLAQVQQQEHPTGFYWQLGLLQVKPSTELSGEDTPASRSLGMNF